MPENIVSSTVSATVSGNGLEHERARLAGIIAQKPAALPAQKALRRRYCRVLAEVAQIVSREPAGSGKRLRGRIERAADALVELSEIVAQMRAA